MNSTEDSWSYLTFVIFQIFSLHSEHLNILFNKVFQIHVKKQDKHLFFLRTKKNCILEKYIDQILYLISDIDKLGHDQLDILKDEIPFKNSKVYQ